MKKPIWIIVDGGDTFEGHQGHWATCFFSNAYESAIRAELDKGLWGQGVTYEIRQMTDEELVKYPEAVEFQESLLLEYGEV